MDDHTSNLQNNHKTVSFDVPPDVVGMSSQFENITGYPLEVVLFQIAIGNYPHLFTASTEKMAELFLEGTQKTERHHQNNQNKDDNTIPDQGEDWKIVTEKHKSKKKTGLKNAKFPFWFHLDPNYANILQKVYKKYDKRISMDQFIELILKFPSEGKTIDRLKQD